MTGTAAQWGGIFGAFLGGYFGANFFIHFLISAPKSARKIIFLSFKTREIFFMRQKVVILPTVRLWPMQTTSITLLAFLFHFDGSKMTGATPPTLRGRALIRALNDGDDK